MDKCLQNTVYRPMKIRTVFSKTDWLGVKNTAVTCGTYQFNNGKKKQLRGIILYIRLIQKIEISERYAVDGHEERDIHIYYNFVGYIEE